MAGNITLIVANRSGTRSYLRWSGPKNRVAAAVVVGSIVALSLVVAVPALRTIFAFAPVAPKELLLALASGPLSLAWYELVKEWRGRRSAP
jgi:Ca2+-transporting ATPase